MNNSPNVRSQAVFVLIPIPYISIIPPPRHSSMICGDAFVVSGSENGYVNFWDLQTNKDDQPVHFFRPNPSQESTVITSIATYNLKSILNMNEYSTDKGNNLMSHRKRNDILVTGSNNGYIHVYTN